MLAEYSCAENLRSAKETGDPPAYLIGTKGTTSGGFVTASGDVTGYGIPVGDKHSYPYGAECMNINNIILAGREKAAKNSGMITYKYIYGYRGAPMDSSRHPILFNLWHVRGMCHFSTLSTCQIQGLG